MPDDRKQARIEELRAKEELTPFERGELRALTRPRANATANATRRGRGPDPNADTSRYDAGADRARRRFAKPNLNGA
jgi:hypothetical protein